MDHGELVMPGMLGMERTTIKSKEDDTDSSHIIFSPSIKYAASFSKFEYVISVLWIDCQLTNAFARYCQDLL